jgi:hypothetical protein
MTEEEELKLKEFVKQTYPDLDQKAQAKKFMELGDGISKKKTTVNETPDPEQTQGSRFGAIKDDKNIFNIPKIPRFNDMEDKSVKE